MVLRLLDCLVFIGLLLWFRLLGLGVCVGFRFCVLRYRLLVSLFCCFGCLFALVWRIVILLVFDIGVLMLLMLLILLCGTVFWVFVVCVLLGRLRTFCSGWR